MSIKKFSIIVVILALNACSSPSSYSPTTYQSPKLKNYITQQNFLYTPPNGHPVDLAKIYFKTNGMVRTETPDVLGIGGTTYANTRFGAWNSKTGSTDLFAIGTSPTTQMSLEDEQIYYGRAIRSTKQSVYDNRLTYSLNFNDKSFVGFSVSTPDISTFGNAVLMNGTIQGNQIEGTVQSGSEKGVFSGQFYGKNGTEMIGIARFNNTNLDFAFGGDLQQ